MLSHRNIVQFYCAVTKAPNFCLVTGIHCLLQSVVFVDFLCHRICYERLTLCILVETCFGFLSDSYVGSGNCFG